MTTTTCHLLLGLCLAVSPADESAPPERASNSETSGDQNPNDQNANEREASNDRKANDGKVAGGDRVIATVLGKKVLLKNVTPASAAKTRRTMKPAAFEAWLRQYRANLMLYALCSPVKRDYVQREKLRPTDEEIVAILKSIHEKHRAHFETLDEKEKQKAGMRAFWVKAASVDWRTAEALHAEYGGRVGISSFGACTAIDGLVKVLEEAESRGDLTFHDEELERAFWKTVKRAPFTDVVLRPERVPQHFATPPWERYRRDLAAEAALREAARKKAAADGANDPMRDEASPSEEAGDGSSTDGRPGRRETDQR